MAPHTSRPHDESVAELLSDIDSVLRGRGRTSPLEALMIVSELRPLLARLETASVVSARHEGVTWQQIGRCLAVPRQNVHRRFGPACYRGRDAASAEASARG